METLFKVIVTLGVLWFIYFQITFLWKFWHSQVDPTGTIDRVIEKLKPDSDVIATRDPNRLYQNGYVVGNVDGEVSIEGDTVVFTELSETAKLNENEPFQYQRLSLKIKNIQHRTGILATMKGPKNAVLRQVVCKKTD